MGFAAACLKALPPAPIPVLQRPCHGHACCRSSWKPCSAGDMYLALAAGLEQCPNTGGSYSEGSLKPAQIRDNGREPVMTCVCPACKASSPAPPSLKFYAYAAPGTYTWHDEADHACNISQGERGEHRRSAAWRPHAPRRSRVRVVHGTGRESCTGARRERIWQRR